MPRHRRILWVSLSAVAIVSCTISMVAAQDPFDAPEKAGPGSQSGGSKAAPKKSTEKAADDDAAKKPEPEFVQKTLQEWQRTLPRDVFAVTRLKATEPPFSGRYATGHYNGTFVCACCNAELFSSRTKFDSLTGWPSFWQPINGTAIDRAIDNSEAEPRMEVMCHRCGAHLGHVFDDGPPPTGLRFCINSLSLKLKPAQAAAGRATSTKAKAKAKGKTAATKSKAASRSTGTQGTKNADQPPSPAADDAAPAKSGTPAAGKTDDGGR